MSTQDDATVYISYDLSRAWHIARRDDLGRSLCGRQFSAHGIPGWPRTTNSVHQLFGEYPALCRECNDARPIAPHEAIRIGSRVTRRDARERQTTGVVTAIVPATYRLPAVAKVRWENATRRLSGSMHTTSTVRLDRLAPIA